MNDLHISTPIAIDEKDKAEIKAKALSLWDSHNTKNDLLKTIENCCIFGPDKNNVHYLPQDIMAILDEVEKEKQPKDEIIL